MGLVPGNCRGSQSYQFDSLVDAGVRGLLNLTPAHVQAPGNVAVVDAWIIASLQELSYLMKVTGRG